MAAIQIINAWVVITSLGFGCDMADTLRVNY